MPVVNRGSLKVGWFILSTVRKSLRLLDNIKFREKWSNLTVFEFSKTVRNFEGC